MKVKVTPIVIGVALYAVALAALADPAPAIPSTGVMDDILNRFHTASAAWAGTITAYASWLFWTLTLISMVWTFGMMALRRADLGEFFAEFIRFTVFTGFFFWLLTNGPNFASDIITSLRQIGAQASGTSAITPSSIVDIGFAVFNQVVSKASFWSPGITTGAIIIGAVILCVLALVAVDMLLLLVASWFLIYAGIYFLGFGGSRWTSDMAIGYYKAVLGIAIQLFTMVLIVGIGQSFLDQYYQATAGGFTLQALGELLVVSIILLLLVGKLPPMLASIVGGPQINTSGIGAGALMAGAAMAGAAIASGGAALAAGGAEMAGGAKALMAAFQSASGSAGEGGAGDGSGLSGAMGGGAANDSNGGAGLAAAMGGGAGGGMASVGSGGTAASRAAASMAGAGIVSGIGSAMGSRSAPGGGGGGGSAGGGVGGGGSTSTGGGSAAPAAASAAVATGNAGGSGGGGSVGGGAGGGGAVGGAVGGGAGGGEAASSAAGSEAQDASAVAAAAGGGDAPAQEMGGTPAGGSPSGARSGVARAAAIAGGTVGALASGMGRQMQNKVLAMADRANARIDNTMGGRLAAEIKNPGAAAQARLASKGLGGLGAAPSVMEPVQTGSGQSSSAGGGSQQSSPNDAVSAESVLFEGDSIAANEDVDVESEIASFRDRSTD